MPNFAFQVGQKNKLQMEFVARDYFKPAAYACKPGEYLFQISSPGLLFRINIYIFIRLLKLKKKNIIGDGFTVLGASFLQRFAVVIERSAGRIGFAWASNCPQTTPPSF